MTKTGVWTFLFLMLAISCAVPVPPTGGPEDKNPPKIAAIMPDSAATNVSVTSPLTVTFSESMFRSKIERLISTFPPFEVGDVKWSKNSLTIQPLQPWIADTTILLVIKPGFRDSHNVPNDKGFSSVFATAAHIDSGSISGSVLFRRKPSAKAMVRCFVIRSDTTFEPAAARPDRETRTDAEGMFTFSYLPTDRARCIIWAFQDENGNAYFERGKEFGETYQDTITLTPAVPRMGDAAIAIIDPTEPGEIEGVIVNHTGADTIPIAVALYARTDTVVNVALYSLCDPSGIYHFKKVAPDGYMLRAFIDFKPDSLCGPYPCFDDSVRMCVEPCVEYPDSVRVEPGTKVKLDSLVLEPAREVRNDS